MDGLTAEDLCTLANFAKELKRKRSEEHNNDTVVGIVNTLGNTSELSPMTTSSTSSFSRCGSVRHEYNELVTSNKQQIVAFSTLQYHQVALLIANRHNYDLLAIKYALFLKTLVRYGAYLFSSIL